MWLDCFTQEQIADVIGVDHTTVGEWILGEKGKLSEIPNTPPESRQHFDVWDFAMPKENNSSYFGRVAPQIVENILWLYTENGKLSSFGKLSVPFSNLTFISFLCGCPWGRS